MASLTDQIWRHNINRNQRAVAAANRVSRILTGADGIHNVTTGEKYLKLKKKKKKKTIFLVAIFRCALWACFGSDRVFKFDSIAFDLWELNLEWMNCSVIFSEFREYYCEIGD